MSIYIILIIINVIKAICDRVWKKIGSKGGRYPVEAGVSAEAGAQRWNEEGGRGQVVQEVRALAQQQVHFVPPGHRLVQSDPPQTGGPRQVPVQHPST